MDGNISELNGMFKTLFQPLAQLIGIGHQEVEH